MDAEEIPPCCRNAEEIVTKEELEALLATKDLPGRILVSSRPDWSI